MKNLVIGLLAVVSLPAFAHTPEAAHLTFANGTVHAHAQWVTGPVVNAESVLQIDWKDGATHQPMAAPGNFEVEPWMQMGQHGHGTSENTIVQAVDQKNAPILGRFLVKEIYFSMPCTWEIRVHVTYANGSKETRSFNQEVEPSKCGGHGHGHRAHRH